MSDQVSAVLSQVCGFPLFAGLESDRVERLIAQAEVQTYRHRQYCFQSGESASHFYIVLEGALKLIRISPRGEDMIMHFAMKGDVVGGLLMNQGPGAVYPISAKSMGQTRVLRMPKSLFRSYWQTDALVQSRMNGLLYQRMSTIQDDKTMSTSPLRVRIAHLLLRHLDQESEFVSQNLSLNLTRQEIADALGVAVESVIRAMREWVEDGTITRSADTKLERINIQKLVVLLDS